MPGGDRTGPEGRGPLTGRRLGYCRGSEFPGDRFFRGFGRGRGRGFGRGFTMNMEEIPRTDVNEIDSLKDRIRYLEEELQKTMDRLNKD